MRAIKASGLIALSLFVLVFALIGLLYVTRGTPVSTVLTFGGGAPPPVGDSLFRRTVELLSGMTLKQGNDIELLVNGDETFARVWADLGAAKQSITVQFYYSIPGKVATRMKDILIERARAGVKILFLRDAFGSQRLTDEYEDSLVNAGVRVAEFRPPRWYQLDKAAHRSHIRVIVVDGHVGYTGGFGLDDKFLGDGRREGSWRDSNVRFTGPAVMQLQATFAAGWAEATGELLTGDVFFPLAEFRPDGDYYAALLYTAPTTGSTEAERFLVLSLAGARKTVYISNSYFVPDDDFRRLLVEAARRGVDVRLLTAGDKTDIKTTLYAGRRRYEELLAGGVRIYEYQPSMMHAKTFVIDGVWSTVGTMNFDNRSLAFNDETNLVAFDSRFGAAMDSIFLKDLRFAKEIHLEEFRRRPWYQKFLENGAHLLSRVL